MKKTNLPLIFAVILLCVGVLFCSCKKNEVKTPDASAVNSSEVVEDDDGADKAKDETEAVPEEPKFYNKLTGVETTESFSKIRPVAIMINNIEQATPQQGISAADVVYEVLAEGGITRLLCLFTEYATLPETGSIRSSRDYFIDLSDAHDAIYVHCGGSPVAYETLTARKTDNMDGISFNIPFYRNEWRKKNMGMEHSMMTTGEKLVAGITQKGYRTESDAEQPLEFAKADTVPTGEKADYIKVKFSYYATAELDYDKTAGVYLKKQYGAPHIDSNNNVQLTFENVVILYCAQGPVPNDEKGRIAVNFVGSGDGYFMSDGICKKIKWSKTSRTSSYTLLEEDGLTELLLNPGKTYIAVASPNAETVFN